MAKRNYLVEGLSGAGKSSVYEELVRRGYKAISTDRAWKRVAVAEIGPPGRPVHSRWDEQKALSELERLEPDVLFVCGSSRNRDQFLGYFTKVFNLRIDDDTMRRRLDERTNNEFGKQPEELELMLRLNRSGTRPAGAIDVDATQPLDKVVDEVLRLANCDLTSDAPPTPWSKRGSTIGRSFVISESALPVAPAAVLERETGTRFEYAWSGNVLAALLPCLAEQGIDLMHSDHNEAAWPTSGAVLTPDDRQRYLARLDPSAFDGAELRRHYEKLNETAADGVEYAMLDGIAFLRDTLAVLEPGTVALLIIG